MPFVGQPFTLQASTTQTTTGVSANAFQVDNFKELLVFLNVSAASGTTPSLTITLQTQDPTSSAWVNIPNGAFTPVTTVGESVLSLGDQLSDFGNNIRATWTISGTTPSFTFTVTAEGK